MAAEPDLTAGHGRARQLHYLIAFLTGGLLAFMLLANSRLAEETTPGFASWAAHASGSVVALLVLSAAATRRRKAWIADAPAWAFTGGVFGALIVAVTAIAVNSPLALAGTLALGLAGQAAFGIVADRFGLFGLPRRAVALRDLAPPCQ